MRVKVEGTRRSERGQTRRVFLRSSCDPALTYYCFCYLLFKLFASCRILTHPAHHTLFQLFRAEVKPDSFP